MADYKPALTDYDRPSLAVDVVLLTVVDGALKVLLIDRDDGLGWALPGTFVRIEEGLDAAVRRLLADKARLPDAFVEQLYTFGAPDRDPRGRVVSVAYYGLVPAARLTQLPLDVPGLTLAGVEVAWSGETGGPARALDGEGRRLDLAFDHADILGLTVQRLRGKLNWSAVGLELLGDLFPLRDLQTVHEAILGARLSKPAFRRRMLDTGLLRPTGLQESASAFRPAELYRRAPTKE